MKSKLYTRTGDAGTTSLVGGERVKKNCPRLEAYGTIDELSSAIGLIAADPKCTSEVRGQLLAIQNELFNIGSYLACDNTPAKPAIIKWHCADKIAQLESWIDALDDQTPPVNAFILPGGCKTAAKAHLARTICRRVERALFSLADTLATEDAEKPSVEAETFRGDFEPIDPNVTTYINRLSDYLFILARYLNFQQGISEIVWHPAPK